MAVLRLRGQLGVALFSGPSAAYPASAIAFEGVSIAVLSAGDPETEAGGSTVPALQGLHATEGSCRERESAEGSDEHHIRVSKSVKADPGVRGGRTQAHCGRGPS